MGSNSEPEREFGSLNDLILFLRREEVLSGEIEEDLYDPETEQKIGRGKVPPYLYRGEMANFETTEAALWRIWDKLSNDEREYLNKLVRYVVDKIGSFAHIPKAESCGYAQHYKLYTPLIDFTGDVYVATHFALGPSVTDGMEKGYIIRLDMRTLAEPEYRKWFRPIKLGRTFRRPTIQSAWTIEPPVVKSEETNKESKYRNLKFEFYRQEGLVAIFSWKRNPEEDEFYRNTWLECPPDDPYVAWPVLWINEFVEEEGPMSKNLADRLLERIDLYDVVGFFSEELAPGEVPKKLTIIGIDPRRKWTKDHLRSRWTS